MKIYIKYDNTREMTDLLPVPLQHAPVEIESAEEDEIVWSYEISKPLDHTSETALDANDCVLSYWYEYDKDTLLSIVGQESGFWTEGEYTYLDNWASNTGEYRLLSEVYITSVLAWLIGCGGVEEYDSPEQTWREDKDLVPYRGKYYYLAYRCDAEAVKFDDLLTDGRVFEIEDTETGKVFHIIAPRGWN